GAEWAARFHVLRDDSVRPGETGMTAKSCGRKARPDLWRLSTPRSRLRGGPGCSPLHPHCVGAPFPGPSPTPRNLRFRGDPGPPTPRNLRFPGDPGSALLAYALLMRVLRCSPPHETHGFRGDPESAARAHSDHLAPRCLGRVSGRTSEFTPGQARPGTPRSPPLPLRPVR